MDAAGADWVLLRQALVFRAALSDHFYRGCIAGDQRTGWLMRRPTKLSRSRYLPQHFLYFFPLPHGYGSLRPTLGGARKGFDHSREILILAQYLVSEAVVRVPERTMRTHLV